MTKTVMILGAGYGQLPAIRKAKERGYTVLATSCYADDVGMVVADIPLTIDTTDIDRSLSAARTYKIDGVLTMATDVAIPTVGTIVDTLGLVGPSFQATLFSTNKLVMKQRLLERNVPTAAARWVRTLDEAHAALRELALPVMFKTVDSSGSRGITKITQAEQLEAAFAYAQTHSRSDTFLIEEFLEGREFGAQGLVYKGVVQFVFPHNDTVTPPPFLTPIGHSYPMDLTAKEEREIARVATACVQALAIDNALLNFDMMLTPTGPKIIEVGARMGATCLPELTTIYSGIDLVALAVDLALGNDINLPETIDQQPCAALLIRAPRTGVLTGRCVPESVLTDPRLVAVRWDKQPGDHVRAFTVGPDRIGEIVVRDQSWCTAEAYCRDIERQLTITVDEL